MLLLDQESWNRSFIMSQPKTFQNSQPEFLYQLIPCIPTLDKVVICKDTLKVGRSTICDIRMDNHKINKNHLASVSKVHFSLTVDPTTKILYLTDSSKNGTFVSGIRVAKQLKIPLKDNAKIAIGHKDFNVYTVQIIENLPDTLTEVGTYISQSIESRILPIWGRLISYMLYVESYDLYSDEFKVGRSLTCDVSIERTNIKRGVKSIFSKEHFIIFKDPNYPISLIKDLSKTGTYLNDRLIGKNNTNILQDNDTISIGRTKIKLFLYKSMLSEDLTYLPPELQKTYVPTKLLGSGAVGEVRLAYEKLSCKMVAIKKILKGRSTTSQMYKLNHPSKINTEISILQTLKHPFIISMRNIVETTDEVYIVLEYMKGGELTNRIISNVPLTESNTKFLFYQMVLAVEYLHSKGITHRDLKPDNVLLSSEEIETLVKVSDFGLSKVTEGEDMMRTMCGTMSYIAPEMIDDKVKEYNKQVDVWSMGVILFYMLSRTLPFKSTNRSELVGLIKSGNFVMDETNWNGVSAKAKDLVKRMLTVNPEQRISVQGILKHPWLAKDAAMQYKVQRLLESNLGVEEVVLTYNLEPPSKRFRLESDECSTSSA